MNYIDFTAGGKDYKLRLNIRNTVALEKQLGCNPISIFGTGETLPTITQMVQVLHASLQQYQHSISFTDAETIFEEWLADGNTITDFLTIIIDIYKASGIIGGEKSEKNA